VLGMAKSLRNEFARRGIKATDPVPGQAVGLSLCVCACCSIIPVLGILAALGALVLWVVLGQDGRLLQSSGRPAACDGRASAGLA
jgi:hypothetical protein